MKNKALMTDKDTLLIDIGLRMQTIRKRLGFKQQNFAGELGISPASLSEIEAGRSKPMFDTIFNLTKKFRVNVYYLLHGQGEMFFENEIEASIGTGNYGDYREWLRKFLYYFRESEMVRYSMMSYFKKYLLENERIIEKEINLNQQSNEEDNHV
ncbi:MAG: repressor LexA [Acidobacteriota bacterium]|nr:repressor LexA [Acidobacteriota bacterium]